MHSIAKLTFQVQLLIAGVRKEAEVGKGVFLGCLIFGFVVIELFWVPRFAIDVLVVEHEGPLVLEKLFWLLTQG